MDTNSVWVAVEYYHYGDVETSEVVSAGYDENILKFFFGDVDWHKDGERWSAALQEGVGGMYEDSRRVTLYKTALVDA